MQSMKTVCLALAFLLASALPSAAQTLYGSVVGIVLDSSGAQLPNAKVTLTNKGTGLVLDAVSGTDGTFTLPNVVPGNYDAKASVAGFKGQSLTNLAIAVNTVSRLDFKMEIGAVSDQITVAAEVAQLQTDKADTHTEIRSDMVINMPLPGLRNYQSLINLVPGATPASFQNSITDTPMRSLRTNINGTNANNNVTRLDGATSVNLWLPHHAGYVMPAEMIETVNVTTVAGDAEQGMAGGAAITLVTKSGTNAFHGSAFWFHDNQRLRARNFFSTIGKPVSIFNNFGGTIGGPIAKNKLFFFYSYDNTKQRIGQIATYNVPTAGLRAGNFSNQATQIFDPLTGNIATGTGRSVFPGNIIPGNRISPIAQRIQSFYPAPNFGSSEQQNFQVAATPLFNRDYNDIKLNYQRNQNHVIWGRYGQMAALSGGRGVFGDGVGPAPGADPGLGDTRVKNMAIGHTLTLSSNLLIDGVIGYQRMDQVVQGQDFGKDFSTSLGIPGLGGPDPRQQGFPNIGINGYNGFGVPNWMPAERIEESFTISQNVRWVKGKHNLAFGFDGVLHRLNHWQPEIGGGPRGAFNFNGGVTGNGTFNNINGYAAFLLGLPNQISKSIQNILATGREYQFGFYAQDRFQATRKLTVSWGLRYEYYPLMGRSNGFGIERYVPDTNQVFMGGRGNVPRSNGFSVSKLNLAPRLGLAYRLNDKTVLRTGYGINYSPLPWSRPLRGFFPLTVNFSFPSVNDNVSIRSLAEGIPPVFGPDLSTGVLNLPAAADMRSPVSGRITRGYIQSWNFTLERRLPGSIVSSIAYVGTQTTHMMADRDVNSGQVLGAGNLGRPFSAPFGRNIPSLLWDGYLSSNYHALQTSVRRQAKGLTLQGAYTWSKALNMADDEGWVTPNFNWGPAFRRNYAAASFDRRHNFQLGYVYELPLGKGKQWANGKVADAVIGGWQVSGVTSAFTGTPFNPSSPAGTLNLPGNIQTPDQVKADVGRPEGIGTTGTFYDTSAFAALPTGQAPRFGSMGRNSLRNPGIFRNDITLSKNFNFWEKVTMNFRAEAFNVTNSRLSTGFGSGDVTNINFLRVTSSADERQIRFALRFQF